MGRGKNDRVYVCRYRESGTTVSFPRDLNVPHLYIYIHTRNAALASIQFTQRAVDVRVAKYS